MIVLIYIFVILWTLGILYLIPLIFLRKSSILKRLTIAVSIYILIGFLIILYWFFQENIFQPPVTKAIRFPNLDDLSILLFWPLVFLNKNAEILPRLCCPWWKPDMLNSQITPPATNFFLGNSPQGRIILILSFLEVLFERSRELFSLTNSLIRINSD